MDGGTDGPRGGGYVVEEISAFAHTIQIFNPLKSFVMASLERSTGDQ